MAQLLLRLVTLALVGTSSVSAASCPTVTNNGEPTGLLKNVTGTQIYHSYPRPGQNNTNVAILHITDIFGVPLLENKLLADSFANQNYLVIMPDLFRGDAVPANALEAGLNLTSWSARHPVSDVDSIIAKTIAYMREELGVRKIGAVGYCFGGKYVPRWLAEGKGIDVGFIAHPSNLMEDEIRGIEGKISIAAGQLDNAFNATARRSAEEILGSKNVTFQSTLYSGAPHGFAVRPNLTVPVQKYAKEASFLQAVTWFDSWL